MKINLKSTLERYPSQFWLLFWGMLISTAGASMIWPFLMIYVSEKLSSADDIGCQPDDPECGSRTAGILYCRTDYGPGRAENHHDRRPGGFRACFTWP